MRKNDYTTFEPWFGSWPPEFKEEAEEGEMHGFIARLLKSREPIFAFIVIGVVGYLLLFKEGILHDFGTALIISGVIGLIVELSFVTYLAQRVFEISFGYLLPPELKPGLRWIYGQKIICTTHKQTVDITIHPNNPEVVVVETKLERTFENISGSTTDIPLSFSIEEHFRAEGNSDILDLSYCMDKGDYVEISNKKRLSPKGNLDIEGEKIKLGSKSKLYTSSKSRVLKHIADISAWHFGYATKEPEVTVNLPESLGYTVGFEYAGDKDTEPFKLNANTWKLPTTLLPKHPINIHWFPKDKIAK